MSGTQKTFGSVLSTGKKLDIISEYLNLYQKTVGKFDWSRTIYVDAFAGTGEIRTSNPKLTTEPSLDLGEELDLDFAKNFIKGSTQLALEVSPPFNKYLFIEKAPEKLEELKENLASYKHANRVDYKCGDANDEVIKFCNSLKNKDRAVIFLDPFGSQVSWTTIEAIAQTNQVDLWYLFPAGLSVYRQISNKGTVHSTHAPSLDRLFGTQDWRTAFIKPKSNPTLFDTSETTMKKEVTPSSAADFMIERMKEIFRGGVGDFKIPLGKKEHGYPSYFLLFAWSNPSGAARSLAAKLSKAAVKASENKDGQFN